MFRFDFSVTTFAFVPAAVVAFTSSTRSPALKSGSILLYIFHRLSLVCALGASPVICQTLFCSLTCRFCTPAFLAVSISSLYLSCSAIYTSLFNGQVIVYFFGIQCLY